MMDWPWGSNLEIWKAGCNVKSVIGECKMLLIKIKMSWNPYRSCWT